MKASWYGKRVLAEVGVVALNIGRRLLMWAADKGQLVTLHIRVYEPVSDEMPRVAYEDEVGLAEAIAMRLPKRGRGDN